MELSPFFVKRIKEIDPCLDACFDASQDAIQIWAVRSGGKKVHELEAKRQFAESYPELERRTVNLLMECDIWKRHGDGLKYDDHLQVKYEKHLAERRREYEAWREAQIKDDKWIIRAAMESPDKVTSFKIPTSTGTDFKKVKKPRRKK